MIPTRSMNQDGSKFMAMCSVHRHSKFTFARSLESAIRSLQLRSLCSRLRLRFPITKSSLTLAHTHTRTHHSHCSRGTILTATVVCYVLSSFIGGYSGVGMYSRTGGRNWIKCAMFTAGLFPVLCLCVGFLLNLIAYSYHSLNFIPIPTLVRFAAFFPPRPLCFAHQHARV